MSFDSHSLERLRELGRSLPQPLPKPEPRATPKARASEPRHKVETETNPDQLFRELIQASADGTVPPHLLDRLRQLESARVPARPAALADPKPPGGEPGRSSRPRTRGGPDSEEASLYTAFQQLLLEDEEV